MHQSNPDDQLRRGMDGNQACLQCHQNFRGEALALHTRHSAGSQGSLCYNCHMPHTVFGIMKSIRSHQIDSPTVAASLQTGRPNACNLCHLDKSLGWTAEQLHKWFGQPVPAMENIEREIASGALWVLKGDAGQRVLVAAAMGHTNAQQAANGSSWFPPYLIHLLNDPYSVVRYTAGKSLQSLAPFAGFDFNYVAPETARNSSQVAAEQLWRNAAPGTALPGQLLQSGGIMQTNAWNELLGRRDLRPIHLRE